MNLTLLDIQWQFIIGGLGIFLYGIKLMGDNLTKFAGSKLRELIEKYTSNPLIAIVVGIVITGMIQSSSATTVIAISLVSAGLMSLDQAIGVTLGANIGTTVTAILIGFDLDYLSYFILFLGILLILSTKKQKSIYLGEIIIGFGLLFIGLNMMGTALKQLQYLNGFEEIIISMSNTPVIGVITGSIITAIVQSSSAIVGIIQKLYDTGSITLIASIELVFGANIGTCVTAVIASIGGNIAAKRTSTFHLLFNISVSLVFLFFITPYTHLIEIIAKTLSLNNMMTIAVAHFLFNVIGVIIYLPLIKKAVKLLERILPSNKSNLLDINDVELDDNLAKTSPTIALSSAFKAIEKLSELSLYSIECSKKHLISKDDKYFKEVNQTEDLINTLDTKITGYLVEISRQELGEDLIQEQSLYLQIVKNYERIADLAQNLSEYYNDVFNNGEDFPEELKQQILEIYDVLIKNYNNGTLIFKNKDKDVYDILVNDENNLNYLEHNLEQTYFRKISTDYQKASIAGSLFIDILGTLERMGDHAFNIAQITFNPIKTHKEKNIKN